MVGVSVYGFVVFMLCWLNLSRTYSLLHSYNAYNVCNLVLAAIHKLYTSTDVLGLSFLWLIFHFDFIFLQNLFDKLSCLHHTQPKLFKKYKVNTVKQFKKFHLPYQWVEYYMCIVGKNNKYLRKLIKKKKTYFDG